MSTIVIENATYKIKVGVIGTLERDGFGCGLPLVVIPKGMVLAKNSTTNIYETVGFMTLGLTKDDMYILQADLSDDKLKLSEVHLIRHNTYKIDLAPANVFYIVIGNTVYIMTVLDMQCKTDSSYANTTLLLTPNKRAWFVNGISAGIVGETTPSATTPSEVGVGKIAPSEVSPSEAASSEISSSAITPQPIDGATPKPKADPMRASLPMLIPTKVYGITVWMPPGFIKSRAEFRITLEENHDLSAIVIHTSDEGYVIKPLPICPKTNCIKITFRDGVYAIGFADINGEKCADPPISDIELFLPTKQ